MGGWERCEIEKREECGAIRYKYLERKTGKLQFEQHTGYKRHGVSPAKRSCWNGSA